MAVHDDVDGTRFEKRPTCARNAAAMLDEPPVIELIEAFRLDGFERSKNPTGNTEKRARETLELKSTPFYMSQLKNFGFALGCLEFRISTLNFRSLHGLGCV